MNIVELIQKKRDGQALADEELAFIIAGYLNDSIPDYQVSALLMATYFRDMDERETVTLTRLMRDSGVVLDFSHLPGPKVDKHSTGGVGDKVSLILAPLMAAAGVYVPMISGRGLGHTGGTLDKLESIPGFRTQLTLDDFRDYMGKIGTCLIGQTADICPADRRLYALRDVTGTVPVMPLICASILSKKLAEGLNALVLDVKTGGGAIFANAAQAEELAQRLIQTARYFNLRTIALLSDMSQPLGYTIGNWLEVLEALEVLQGRGPEDVRQVTLALGAAMLQAAGRIADARNGMAQLAQLLQNGAAWKKFLEIVKAQGGDTAVLEQPEKYPKPRHREQILAGKTGYVANIDARRLGHSSMNLGAGRVHLAQPIDPLAGMTLHKKVGDRVERGEPLATLQSSTVVLTPERIQTVYSCYELSSVPPQIPAVIIARMDETGKYGWE